jgi:copper chaperone
MSEFNRSVAMTLFHVPDMTCGDCVASITTAVKRADPTATVLANLDAHELRVTATLADAALLAAIEDTGFSPELRAA